MSRRSRLGGLNAQGLLQQGLGAETEATGTGSAEFPELPGFEIRSVLGRGSTGLVYEGWQESLQRPVAIKVLTPQHLEDELLRERLAREARIMASLRHPHIVGVHDFAATEDGGAGIVMELISGPSLRHLLREEGTLPLERAVELARQIASGLAVAHRAELTHRDLKPENVLIDSDGSAKVTDFGIAFSDDGAPRLTLTGMRLGTEGYMAPEQVEALEVDARCDVFSLGVLLYEMLKGELPSGRIDQVGALCPDLPDSVCAILTQAMQPDREKRLQTMDDFGAALADLELKSDSGNTGWWGNLMRWIRKEEAG